MTTEDRSLIDMVMGMFRELSQDVRVLREENKQDHIAQQVASAELDKKITEALRRQDGHDAWHGKNDEEIAKRLKRIEDADHDDNVADGAVAAYKARFAWVAVLGLDAVKMVALTGVGAVLVGAGWVLRMLFG